VNSRNLKHCPIIRNRNWCWGKPRAIVEKPENEDEEAEQSEECGDVVHCVKHNDQLVTQRRQKSNQLEYSQQPKCSKYRQTGSGVLEQLCRAVQHKALSLPVFRRKLKTHLFRHFVSAP